MADGVTIDNGGLSDFTAATDDCGGAGHAAIVKLAYSADGVATLVTADSSGLEVQLGAALPAGTNAIGKLAANSGVDIGDVDVTTVVPGTGATNLGKAEDAAHSSGDTGVMALGVRKDTAAALAGTDGDYQPLIFDSNGLLYVNPGVLVAGSDFVSLGAATSGGCSVYKSLDLDESEEEAKSSAGTFYGFYFVNRTTSVRYFKLYDNTAAGTTVGTTTPTATYELPANSSDHVAGNILTPAMGVACATGITVAVTTGFADNDTGAPGANDVIVVVYYK